MRTNKTNHSTTIATLRTTFGLAIGLYISTAAASAQVSNDNEITPTNVITDSISEEKPNNTPKYITDFGPPATLKAEGGKPLWKMTPNAAHHNAIVEIHSMGGTGTGIVIEVDKDKPLKGGYEGYALTAFHVVQDDKGAGEIKIKYRNKKNAKKCRIVAADEHQDVALLWTWVPKGIEPAKLSNEPIQMGDALEFAGLGGNSDHISCTRHFSGVASSPSSNEKIFADVPLLPGDSGGPVFNDKNEVVGIISGGWFWFNSGLKTPNGSSIRTTWPARTSNLGPLQKMIEDKNEKLENKDNIALTLSK